MIRLPTVACQADRSLRTKYSHVLRETVEKTQTSSRGPVLSQPEDAPPVMTLRPIWGGDQHGEG